MILSWSSKFARTPLLIISHIYPSSLSEVHFFRVFREVNLSTVIHNSHQSFPREFSCHLSVAQFFSNVRVEGQEFRFESRMTLQSHFIILKLTRNKLSACSTCAYISFEFAATKTIFVPTKKSACSR